MQLDIAFALAADDPSVDPPPWDAGVAASPGRCCSSAIPSSRSTGSAARTSRCGTGRSACSRTASSGLGQNFRTVPPLLEWVNRVFGAVIAEGAEGVQPPYEALAPFRPDVREAPAVVVVGSCVPDARGGRAARAGSRRSGAAHRHDEARVVAGVRRPRRRRLAADALRRRRHPGADANAVAATRAGTRSSRRPVPHREPVAGVGHRRGARAAVDPDCRSTTPATAWRSSPRCGRRDSRAPTSTCSSGSSPAVRWNHQAPVPDDHRAPTIPLPRAWPRLARYHADRGDAAGQRARRAGHPRAQARRAHVRPAPAPRPLAPAAVRRRPGAGLRRSRRRVARRLRVVGAAADRRERNRDRDACARARRRRRAHPDDPRVEGSRVPDRGARRSQLETEHVRAVGAVRSMAPEVAVGPRDSRFATPGFAALADAASDAERARGQAAPVRRRDPGPRPPRRSACITRRRASRGRARRRRCGRRATMRPRAGGGRPPSRTSSAARSRRAVRCVRADERRRRATSWLRDRSELLAAVDRRRVWAATALAGEADDFEPVEPRSVDEGEPGSPPVPLRRGGTALGRAVHAVLQSVDFDDPGDVAPSPSVQAAAEGLTGPDDAVEVERRVARRARVTGDPCGHGRRRPQAMARAVRGRAGESRRTGGRRLDRRGLHRPAVRGRRRRARGRRLQDRPGDDGGGSGSSRDAAIGLQAGAYALAVGEVLRRPVSRAVLVFCGRDGAVEHEIDDLPAAMAQARAIATGQAELVSGELTRPRRATRSRRGRARRGRGRGHSPRRSRWRRRCTAPATVWVSSPPSTSTSMS